MPWCRVLAVWPIHDTKASKSNSPFYICRMKSYVFLLLFAFWASIGFAQQQPTPIHVGSDAPEWMHLMKTDHPNVFDVEAAYKVWFADHAFEKTSYTQYYKRWMHWARPFVQANGFLLLPTSEEQAAEEQLRLAQRQSEAQRGNSLSWSFVGPKQTFDVDGVTEVTWQTNIYSFDIAPSNQDILYAGGETGGIWRTADKGLNWTLLTANVLHDAIGAVQIHPSDPNVVYAGTSGKIIKTTDGGATWNTVYSENNLWTDAIAIHPDLPDIVLAATETGLLRSDNGGSSWTKIHNQRTWTVKNQPGNPGVFFAVGKQGSAQDFLRSTDLGATWQTYNTGLWTPASGEACTGALLAGSPSSPNRLYLYLCGSGTNLKGYIGVYRSDDGGLTWTNTQPQNAVGNSPVPYAMPSHTNLMTNNGLFTGFEQGFYDMAIVVNPLNENQLIAGGTSWFRSFDAGATWQPLGGYVGNLAWSHPDIQCLVASGNELWIASDGGLNYSTNFGNSHVARMNGISGSDMWGFDSGWNEDVLVGGRYHNGNMAWHEIFPEGKFYRMGGAESPTGYVNPGDARKTYFSDIGGKRLKGGFNDGVSNFTVGLFPNESYAYYANSEMVWDPRCWNHVYLGSENVLWKSTDGGTSFDALYTFPGNADNTVFDIEISRANANVIYCSQWNGTDDAIWRSDDGGSSWTPCALLPLPNNNDRVKLAAADNDENVLWAALTYGSNGKKIYKTTDGGQTWVNLTTLLLDGMRITNIMAQYGTDGGIYLGTNRGVYYRNNSHSDWQPYNTDLPLSAETNRLKPFYKTGKIRNGCWGFGVWESDLFEPSAVVAQPMASALSIGCARDTVYFDDYSVVQHAGATWEWTFSPAPAFVSDPTVRNPRVVFGAQGIYFANMLLNGQYEKELEITVTDGCRVDSLPGNALLLDGDGYAASGGPVSAGQSSNHITMSAWVKAEGAQTDFAGILFMRGDNIAGGLSVTENNGLRYHWDNSGWWWDSGLTLPDGEWAHVTLVISPQKAVIYLNGMPATHTAVQLPESLDQTLQIGFDNGNRRFRGQIEEVCLWNTDFTQDQVREYMHLTKKPTDFPDLLAYYQFNEPGGVGYDGVASRHMSLVGSATRIVSTAPVGPGTSFRAFASQAGVPFEGTDMTLFFDANQTLPQGEICVTKINILPDAWPAVNAGDTVSNSYWVAHLFDDNQDAALWSMHFENLALPTGQPASAYTLWQRPATADGATWTVRDTADLAVPGTGSVLGFSQPLNVQTLGQFILTMPADSLSTVAVQEKPTVKPDLRVYPNPLLSGQFLQLRSNLDTDVRFVLFDSAGKRIMERTFRGQDGFVPSKLPAGQYFYRMQTGKYMVQGVLQVVE